MRISLRTILTVIALALLVGCARFQWNQVDSNTYCTGKFSGTANGQHNRSRSTGFDFAVRPANASISSWDPMSKSLSREAVNVEFEGSLTDACRQGSILAEAVDTSIHPRSRFWTTRSPVAATHIKTVGSEGESPFNPQGDFNYDVVFHCCHQGQAGRTYAISFDPGVNVQNLSSTSQQVTCQGGTATPLGIDIDGKLINPAQEGEVHMKVTWVRDSCIHKTKIERSQ